MSPPTNNWRQRWQIFVEFWISWFNTIHEIPENWCTTNNNVFVFFYGNSIRMKYHSFYFRKFDTRIISNLTKLEQIKRGNGKFGGTKEVIIRTDNAIANGKRTKGQTIVDHITTQKTKGWVTQIPLKWMGWTQVLGKGLSSLCPLNTWMRIWINRTGVDICNLCIEQP